MPTERQRPNIILLSLTSHTAIPMPASRFVECDQARVLYEPGFSEAWHHVTECEKLFEPTWGVSGSCWRGCQAITTRYWGHRAMLTCA